MKNDTNEKQLTYLRHSLFKLKIWLGQPVLLKLFQEDAALTGAEQKC